MSSKLYLLVHFASLHYDADYLYIVTEEYCEA